MKGLTADAACRAVGAEVRGTLPSGELSAVITDSRQAVPGCLFAAIPGERADGHDYIGAAAERGAVCALCERFTPCDLPQLRVPDVQAALRELAAFYRAQFDIPFIGVTGSVGKTTAKEMIASVLSQRFHTLRTEKNFNNELGVPLTLFRLEPSHEAAVVEMGISHFGEMTRLTAMVRPDIAVFTLIGDAHLEFLGDRAGVLRAKAEILNGMSAGGLVIANGDDAALRGYDFGRETLRFGLGEDCDLRARDLRADPAGYLACVLEGRGRRVPVRVPGVGRHMAYAALMGAAVGMALGLTDDEIARGIEGFKNVGSRGRLVRAGSLTILDDCYNANPTSAAAALDALAAMPGRRVAVLGDMLELGERGPALHHSLGQRAAKCADLTLACGPLARRIAEGAAPASRWYPDTAALLTALPDLIRPGDVILVKASHAMGFDAVTKTLETLGGQEV